MVESGRLNAAPSLGYAATSTGLNADDLLDVTVAEAQAMETALQPGAYLDSDSEDSDSDLSAAEIDSDIEKEKQFTYDRTLYREDYQVGEQPSLAYEDERFLLEIEKSLEKEISTRRETNGTTEQRFNPRLCLRVRRGSRHRNGKHASFLV